MKNLKKKLAKRLLSKEEVERKTSIFTSKNWDLRKEGIAKRIANKNAKIKAKKIETLAKQEVVTKKEIKKLSLAEQRQLKRKAKIIKFTAKLKKVIKL